MSNHPNARRNEEDRTEHGSRWEGDDNSRCASRARSAWKRLAARFWRRTGSPGKARVKARPTPRPLLDVGEGET